MTQLTEMISELGKEFKEKTGELHSRIRYLEQYNARSSHQYDTGSAANRSLGEIVANHDSVKNLSSNFHGNATIKLVGDEVAAITSAPATVGSNTSGSTSLVTAHRVEEIVEPRQRNLVVRDLLNVAQTSSNSIEWPRETAFTNNAAPVAEAPTTSKPQSDITFELETTPVRTIAHIFKASRQILDDAPALAAYIQRRGVYGLKLVEESQILRGIGTGQNLRGIIPQAVAYDTDRTEAGFNEFDVINAAIAQAEESDVPVTGLVLSKAKWRKYLGAKDGEGRYHSGGPFKTSAKTLWDLDVVSTNAMQNDEFLIMAEDGATIFDRMEAEVLISTENEDDFVKNMITIRIEERLALANFRPDAFVYGKINL
ncbi:HK97 family phage major capsid protein [Ochrobactrum sp. BH3]|nr:HK97 family phage major capsid protein [Ochrobactrum sp. BH3]